MFGIVNAHIEETAELTAADFAAISKIIRSIERREEISLDTFAYWKLAFFMCRELDLRYARSKARTEFEASHRTLMTTLMSLMERLSNSIGRFSEADLERIGISHQFFETCLKNTRTRYVAWHEPSDPAALREFDEKIAAASR
jgi:hypothetical protein